MDKGIFIGVEYEAATRTNLSFTMFRQVTSVRINVSCAFTRLMVYECSRTCFSITSCSTI